MSKTTPAPSRSGARRAAAKTARTRRVAPATAPEEPVPAALPASAPEGGAPPQAAGRLAEAVDPLARHDFQRDSLGYALRRAQVRAYDLFFAMLGPLELSPARLTALSLIAMSRDINQASLARKLGIAGPSVLKLIDALESAGLVRRAEVPDDRRRYNLLLTDAGQALMDALSPHLATYEARLAAALSADERRQLMALLDRVALD